jgi:hypoxanthine phosphoribosyltransferase
MIATTYWKSHMQQRVFKYELAGWNKVIQLTRLPAGKFLVSRHRPATVITITRGCCAPARLLCEYLIPYGLTGIRIAHFTSSTGTLVNARLRAGFNADIIQEKSRWLIYPWAVSQDINEILNTLPEQPAYAQAAAPLPATEFHIYAPMIGTAVGYRFRRLNTQSAALADRE